MFAHNGLAAKARKARCTTMCNYWLFCALDEILVFDVIRWGFFPLCPTLPCRVSCASQMRWSRSNCNWKITLISWRKREKNRANCKPHRTIEHETNQSANHYRILRFRSWSRMPPTTRKTIKIKAGPFIRGTSSGNNNNNNHRRSSSPRTENLIVELLKFTSSFLARKKTTIPNRSSLRALFRRLIRAWWGTIYKTI